MIPIFPTPLALPSQLSSPLPVNIIKNVIARLTHLENTHQSRSGPHIHVISLYFGWKAYLLSTALPHALSKPDCGFTITRLSSPVPCIIPCV